MFGQYGMMNYDPSMFESPFVRKLKQQQMNVPETRTFGGQPDFSTRSYSQNYEQGQGQDPFNAQNAFLQHLQMNAPNREDYKVGFGRTALAAIAGGLKAFAGDSDAMQVGMDVRDKKYNEAMFNWQNEGSRLGKAASVEGGMFDERMKQNNLFLSQQNTIEDNKRADAARVAADLAAEENRKNTESQIAERGAANFPNPMTGIMERHYPDGRVISLGQSTLTPQQRLEQIVKQKEVEQPFELEKVRAQADQTRQTQAAAQETRQDDAEKNALYAAFLKSQMGSSSPESPTADKRASVDRVNKLIASSPDTIGFTSKYWDGAKFIDNKPGDPVYQELLKAYIGGGEAPKSAVPAAQLTPQTTAPIGVLMISPQGKEGLVPADKVDAALAAGYKRKG